MVETTQTIQKYVSKFIVQGTLKREYFAIAPMVDVSDNYFRYFMRLLTKHSFLYTEMLNEHAILHACQGRDRLLSFSENQHPVVCQIGGNDPIKCGQAAKVVQEFGYDEVNLNCGCPSNKVRDGCFGARLMFEPNKVAQIVAEMRKQCTIPVTVKCRLGVDDVDKWDDIVNFIKVVSEEGGVTKFIIHARKAHLHGLDPKQNRTIPPLKYDWVFNLKKLFPHLNLVINGGFNEVEKVLDILSEDHELYNNNGLEGCMSGRLAMNNPWDIARIDREVYGDLEQNTMTREEILMQYAEFAQIEQDKAYAMNWKLTCNVLVKPLINLFAGEYANKLYRKELTARAADKANTQQVKKVIMETIACYKEQNPEALQTRNGEKIVKPTWQIEAEQEQLAKYLAEKMQLEGATQEEEMPQQNPDGSCICEGKKLPTE